MYSKSFITPLWSPGLVKRRRSYRPLHIPTCSTNSFMKMIHSSVLGTNFMSRRIFWRCYMLTVLHWKAYPSAVLCHWKSLGCAREDQASPPSRFSINCTPEWRKQRRGVNWASHISIIFSTSQRRFVANQSFEISRKNAFLIKDNWSHKNNS